MFHLDTPSFRLEILDPNGDTDHQGSRYVRGGYLWQARDCDGHPLFAGPGYPALFPSTYDGQGAPEAFRWYDVRRGHFLNLDEGRILVPGVGVIQPSIYEKRIGVEEAATWEVTLDAEECRMTCSQAYAGRAYHLERRWTTESNTLISHTRIRMMGERPMDVHWFAHPFFPPNPEGPCFDPGPDACLPEKSPAYFSDDLGRIHIKTEAIEPLHSFQFLELRGTPRMNATLAHPQSGRVHITGDFPTTSLPIWSNPHTFSPEPHLESTMSPGEEKAWSLRYAFGKEA